MVDLLKSSLSAPIKRIQKHLSKAMELQAWVVEEREVVTAWPWVFVVEVVVYGVVQRKIHQAIQNCHNYS